MSFDTHPTLYWLLGLCGLLLLSGLAVIPVFKPNWRVRNRLFMGMALVLLCFMRLPVVLYNQELNADESQNISHAITLNQNMVYWQDVDGTTIGPLDQYALLLPHYLGFDVFDYTAARWVGLACMVFALLFVYLSLETLFNTIVARLSLLPALGLLAFTQHSGLVHYSSEHVPLALMAFLLWLGARLYASEGRYFRKLFWAGLVAGAIPFGKLQAVPPTVVIGFFLMLLIFQRHRLRVLSSSTWGLCCLIGGAIFFPLVVSILAIKYGVIQDFIRFYISSNLAYGSGQPLVQSLSRLPLFLQQVPDFYAFSLVPIFLIMTIALLGGRKLHYRFKAPVGITYFVFIFLIASLYAVLKPGNEFSHYLLFLVFPITLFNALFINEVIEKLSSRPSMLRFAGAMFVVLVCLPLLLNIWAKRVENLPWNQYESSTNKNRQLPTSEVSEFIKKKAQQGDKLVVWGWACRYYVETQLPEGTAENHTERCIFTHPMQKDYRERFLKDMERNQPRFFIDAVGKNSLWLNNRNTQGHQNWTELKELIGRKYRYLTEIDEVRIYEKI